MAIPLRHSEMVRHRVGKFFVLVTSLYVCLVARLVYLQAIQGGYIRQEAANARSRQIPLTATRGNFLDRNGKPLAVTTHKFMLVADPTLVVDANATADALAKLLHVDANAILKLVQQKSTPKGKPDRYEIIQTEVPPEFVKAFRSITEDKSGDKQTRKSLMGTFLVDRPERTYPAGSEGVHTIGLAQPGEGGRLKGICGMEQSLNETLSGADGFMRAEVDPAGRIIPDTQIERKDPKEGVTVKLTIDATIQHIVETELAKVAAEYRPEGATIIVMDPATGDVLALASSPNFDPNDPQKALSKSLDPLANHALSLFEPGSTLKIITAAAALERGVITPETTFYCGGSYTLGNKQIKCDTHGRGGGHGTVNIRDIIVHSCNVGTAQVGLKLGMTNMEQILRDFNLLDKTGIGLKVDTRGRLGLGAESARNGLGKLGRVAFGQALIVTPLAMATAYAAIANGGVLMKPRLVLSLHDGSGKPMQEFAPEAGRRVVRPETAAILSSLLEGVVTEGTGKGSANIPGYTSAGKTGTAQRVPKGAKSYVRGKYVASFIGFVPAKRPRAAILVLADQPQGGKYYGAQVGAPVFRSIGQQVMAYLKVAPDDPASLGRAARNSQ
jgi:stage V sporulation protein D (sporulation-specific penicillin-binding protein)